MDPRRVLHPSYEGAGVQSTSQIMLFGAILARGGWGWGRIITNIVVYWPLQMPSASHASFSVVAMESLHAVPTHHTHPDQILDSDICGVGVALHGETTHGRNSNTPSILNRTRNRCWGCQAQIGINVYRHAVCIRSPKRTTRGEVPSAGYYQ